MKISFKAFLAVILCIAFCLPVSAVSPSYEYAVHENLCSAIGNKDIRVELPSLTHSLAGEANYSEAEIYHDTFDALVTAIRAEMVARKNHIVIGYKTDEKVTSDIYDKIADEVFVHTGNPKEGDYLWFTFGGYSASCSGYREGEDYYYTFTFEVSYYTTAELEAELDKAISVLVELLTARNASDYLIVKAIYDYICGNVKYDDANLYDNEYKLKYTAYAALINKTAVCQGYSNLFYRLALECGVEARTVSGVSNDVAHSWNIVKLNGYYYNLDTTWDAGYQQSYHGYEYFLRCDENFNDHTLNDRFLTEEFISAHPKHSSDYNVKAPAHNHEYYDLWFIDRYATSGSDGEKYHLCNTCGEKCDITVIPYVNSASVYKNYVTKGWSADGIDFVSSNGFMGDIGNGSFDQTGTMTRSMFVTVLWRIAGKPTPTANAPFTDLDPKQTWYHAAVAWAHENGIVNGTGTYTFSPNGEVTREQIAALLYRYVVDYLGEDVSAAMSDICSFPDFDLVGNYAYNALAWANGAGLIKGQTVGNLSVLAPKSNATREEVAVIIERFCTAK